MKPRVLAKLCRPRLTGIRPRERLFERLDEARQHAVTWIAGPPGAGKTTLVASWLQDRGLPTLWYQVDAGDDDAGSFFFHLGQCVRQSGLAAGLRLPLLSPEYLDDLPGFARRWFDRLFQALPAPCVLVLDNLQDASEAAPLPSMLREAAACTRPGRRLLLLSRVEPDVTWEPLHERGGLALLGWNDLRLTADEAAGIVASGCHGTSLDAALLLHRCGGWAAGLTLLLDHAGRNTDGGRFDGPAPGMATEPSPSWQALFDYFAAEFFDRLPAATRQVLLSTAWLPSVDAPTACRLSDNPEAAALLEGLRRRRLFIERHGGPHADYTYHALFHEFLRARLRQVAEVPEQRRLARDSAQALIDRHDVAGALPLLLIAGQAATAAQLVLREAPSLAAQGRLGTLSDWIRALPSPIFDATPWLGHWLGACLLATDPPAARPHLQRAFEAFGVSGDRVGQALTAARLVDSHVIEWRDFRPCDRWIDELLQLLDPPPAWPTVVLETGVLSSLIGAVVMRQPDHPRLRAHVLRLDERLREAQDVNSRLQGAAGLMQYAAFVHDRDLGASLLAWIGPQLSDASSSPLHLLSWRMMESLFIQVCGPYDAAASEHALAAGLVLLEQHGLQMYRVLLHSRHAWLRLERSDLEGAARSLELARPAPGSRRWDLGWYDGMHSWLALLRGDAEASVRHARQLVDASAAAGGTHPHGMALLIQANALAHAGQAHEAADCLRRMEGTFVAGTPIGALTCGLIRADMALAAGDHPAAVDALHRALETGRRERMFNTLQWLAPQMSRLCAFALDRGIETAYVVELIHRRRIPAPAHASDRWPWPVRVYLMGDFETQVDGQRLRRPSNASARPQELLQVLAALGGRDIPEHRLARILWPAHAPAAAQSSLEVTLHRLRRLLGHNDAIEVTDRRLSLNPRLVWVDLQALEDRLAVDDRASPGAPAGTAPPDAAEVLRLYRGPLLAGRPDEPWLLPVRQRVRGRFERFFLRLCEGHDAAGRHDEAESLWRRVLDVEPSATQSRPRRA